MLWGCPPERSQGQDAQATFECCFRKSHLGWMPPPPLQAYMQPVKATFGGCFRAPALGPSGDNHIARTKQYQRLAKMACSRVAIEGNYDPAPWTHMAAPPPSILDHLIFAYFWPIYVKPKINRTLPHICVCIYMCVYIY